jgi:riboflavin biosynthesis pyrimidine reductase
VPRAGAAATLARMRVLLDPRRPAHPGARVTASELADLYAFPRNRRWVRTNFVSTLDGSGVGADGRSGSINTPPDNRVFALQRDLCDAVLVGSGTAAAEGYRRITPTRRRAVPPALVVVSGSARVPDGLVEPVRGRGAALLVTCEAAGPEALSAAQRALGEDAVVVAGDDSVDLPAALDALAGLGLRHVLCEGGPTLLAAALQAGVVDELALSVVPTLVGGHGTRITSGAALGGAHGIPLAPRLLVEEAGTLMGLWRVRR